MARVHDVIPAQPEAGLFVPGHVYAYQQRRTQLLRLICYDSLNDTLLFKRIAAKWSDTPTPALAIPRKAALKLARQHKLVEKEDYVRPPFMSKSDEELKTTKGKDAAWLLEWLANRNAAFETIKPLVAPTEQEDGNRDPLAALYCPRTSGRVVGAHARAIGMPLKKLQRLLHKFAWFGLDPNSLLSLDFLKGRIGSQFQNYEKKPGPKDSAEIVFGSMFRGRARSQRDLHIFKAALDLFYVKQHMTLVETYEQMVILFYRQANDQGVYPIREWYLPTFRQFTAAAKKMREHFQLDAKRAGHKDGAEQTERRGYDTDIAPEVGTVFDIDGTPFNKELVSTLKVGAVGLNMGKATVIVIFDRRSKKAVGWHVYVGAESWVEGYRLAIFCALTSKKERLEWLGIDAPEAWPDSENIAPSFFYVDGGPGASIKGRAAMTRLSIDAYRGPPDTPYWKPTVEGAQAILQKAQAHDPGGYERTNAAVDKGIKRNAKLFATDSVFEFERKLVLDLIKMNAKWRDTLRLTARMKRDGVEPTCNAVHTWGVKQLGGVERRRLLTADVYEALLEEDDAEVTIHGISKFRARYQSDALRSFRRLAGATNPTVKVLFDPLRPKVIYWRTPDGVIDALERDTMGDESYETASVHDIETYRLHVLAVGIRERKMPKKRRGVLTRKQEEQILYAAGPDSKSKRRTPTKKTTVVRRLEGEFQRNTRPYDQPERHLPLAKPPAPASPAARPVAAPSSARPGTPPSTGRGNGPSATPTDSNAKTSRRSIGPAPGPAAGPLPGRARTADLFAARRKKQQAGGEPEGDK